MEAIYNLQKKIITTNMKFVETGWNFSVLNTKSTKISRCSLNLYRIHESVIHELFVQEETKTNDISMIVSNHCVSAP